jgi:hypothetical protein
MAIKVVAAVVAVVLLMVYLGAIAAKLKDVALSAIMLVGIAMMLIDLWNSLTGKED